MSPVRGPTLLVAGGGTGGHLFPGIALAEELRRAGAEVVFVGTAHGLEARVLPREGWPLEIIDVGGLRGGGTWEKIRTTARLPRSFWQSLRLLRRYHPAVVIGVGGYAAGPVCLAAWATRRPVVILEQNSIPGFTNKVLGRLARRVYATFPDSARYFPRRRVRVAGNPVRARLVPSAEGERPERPFVLFVFGGSQGARALNEAMVGALEHLADLRDELHVIHQTGTAMEDEVRRAYEARGFSAEVYPFIEDMGAMYRRAHLVLSRAGATTLAELALCAKASVLVPYPFAADNHQEHNARFLATAGAAIVVLQRDLGPETLARVVRGLMREPARLRAMEQAARRLARPDAARHIAQECLRLARGEPLPEAA
jgi:UDP-N-acetylglucosamine--N-acetylmuramyl-(pentapeptide) pyrophosphoryl-undecaprenol N-acetylglucosamine transferase